MFSIDFLGYKFYIIVEAEDAGDEQEGLGDIVQQTVRHIVDHDDLISPSAMLFTMSSTAQAYCGSFGEGDYALTPSFFIFGNQDI